MIEDIELRQKKIVKITLIGTVVNGILVLLKLVAGILGKSAAMIADGVHSLSDFLTDFVVIIMMKISSKPSDEDHRYGHGKYETLATTIIGVLLVGVGFGILWSGGKKIWDFFHGVELLAPSWIAFAAAVISIISKEGIYQYTIIAGKDLKSEALTANAWHHRSDALSSIGTAIGIGAACLLGHSWAILDPIAAIIVSLFIFKIAIQLIKNSVNQLLECSLPPEIEDEIKEVIMQCSDVTDLHNLQTRQIGANYAISLHIRMNGDITLHQAHDKATEIEKVLKAKYGEHTFINIHLEPIK